MQLETLAPTSSTRSDRVPKLALSEGASLQIAADAPRTLIDAFCETARKHPAKGIHLVGHDQQVTLLTYSALLKRASCVLAGLRNAGIEPGAKVILQLDSLADHFITFWGCLLGGVVPVTVAIAPSYSERGGVVDKLCNTWRLLEGPAILTNRGLENAIKGLAPLLSDGNITTLCVEDLAACEPVEPLHPAKPDDIVFIQLSSGSTGIPKCIQETHAGIIAHIHSSQQFNNYTSENITLNWLPMDHVVPILTFHLKDTYLGCNQIQVPPGRILAEPLLWLDLIAQHRVTHTWAPNFGFKLVSDSLSRTAGKQWDLSSIQFFMNAGEQVTLPVVRDFLRAVAPFGVREDAMQPAFGMAEVCTCMTYANNFKLSSAARRFTKASLNRELETTDIANGDSAEFVSLGKVSPGITIRIADSNNEVLPEKWIGRLQIKGPVVTPGYFRNDDANQEAFVGDGWFNTGDLGFIADDELFLTGREKEIIIIRGAKFYCYEVEDVVNSIPGVEPTFVATCGTSDSRTGTETLAVFFVPAGVTDELAVAQAVRRHVTARLGIAPGFVVPLSRHDFPKTTSGKIQRTQLRKALEAGAFNSILGNLEAAMSPECETTDLNDLERQVAAIWQEVLGHDHLHRRAHIFECGGDSLKATQIASRIRAQWQTDFPLHLLFGATGTIEGMAQWLEQNLKEPESDTPPPILASPRTAMLPLSYSQLRLWLADQIDPGTSLYNIGRAYSLGGVLNFSALERALTAIVSRHEILRTVYRLEAFPVQQILPADDFRLPRHDLAHLTESERDHTVGNLLSLEIARPFDLSNGPLMRAKLIRLGESNHLLMLTFHQIVTDAWSLGLFARELSEFYARFAANDTAPLHPLPVQYVDYAVWQQRWLADAALEKQMSFWKEQLSGCAGSLSFHPESRAVQASRESTVQPLVLPAPLLRKLREFNSAENVTGFMTLLTVFKLLLSQWTHNSDVRVGSPESGRRRFETEGLLGCFVNMLTLRTRVSTADTFRSMLSRVRQTTVEAFANADVPFEKVQTLARSGDDETRSRLFQVWFGPVDSLQPFTMGDLHAEPQPIFPSEAQFDLSCFLSEQPESITLFFEFRKDLFSIARMTEMREQFRWLLSRLLDQPDISIAQVLEELRHAGLDQHTVSINHSTVNAQHA